MRKTLLFLAISSAVNLFAADYTYPSLRFRLADGTETGLSVENLTMKYADGVLTVSNAKETKQFTASELHSMWFAADVTAIDGVDNDAANGPVEIYTTDGIRLGSYESLDQARTSLNAGAIYIVKTDKGTQKIIVK